MFLRWFRFIQQMLPLQVILPAGAACFLAPYLVGALLSPGPQVDWSLLIGAITLPGMLIVLRTMDELKDYESDQRLNNRRPLVTGVVTVQDLRWLLLALSIIMLVLNALAGPVVFWTFVVVLGYAFLMLKYFFWPRIARSLILAVVTHNPIVPLLNIYALSFVARHTGWDALGLGHVAVVLAFWCPALAWEIARKIRAPAEETEYVTYSRLFGHRRATMLAFSVAALGTVLGVFLSFVLTLSPVLPLVLLGLTGYVGWRMWTFVRTPTPHPAGFRPELEIFMAVFNFGFVAAILIERWRLFV